jgi:hypothetical protein
MLTAVHRPVSHSELEKNMTRGTKQLRRQQKSDALDALLEDE